MGYVYYGNYATYYEIARVEALRQLGFEYKKLEETGTMMPVADLSCKFLRPAKYDELLTISVTVAEMPKARMHFTYNIHNASGVLVNTGTTTLVFIDMQSNRPCRVPEVLKEILMPHFND